ncbi:DUF6286 domain-containing protein [Streptomyces sp. H27-C3]|uniref:DUF6286 domain-containing protein n=1 Tax=Streptomyces sp. H27-C3 TaxID=3046305 RepID=UPI0024B9BD26|nr:DUF6286 domain-containing protein [Streptomyces sp. H27-C3]MDJ0461837.1 DUF6286 domain-containing protein [Streptomyces sp. H27-C3]
MGPDNALGGATPEGHTQRLPVIEREPDPAEFDQSASAAAYEPVPVLEAGSGGRAGRFWSPRRVPAALLALVALGATGLLLYDIAAVRADHSAMRWRRELASQLADRPLDNVWVLVGAGVAMALGLWLLILACTPGLRALLPMRRDSADVRAGLDRDAAALVLRDRAMEVSGVQSAKVRVGRSKVAVRAVSHFRELDDVRTDLDAALGAGIRQLGLAGQPGLSVRVGRPAKKR